MILKEYYNQIIEKYESQEYKIHRFNDVEPPEIIEPHLEAQHFMMFEYMEDHNDDRMFEIFDFIVRPNDFKSHLVS